METFKLVSRAPKMAAYLSKLTSLAFEKAMAALQDSRLLDENLAIENFVSKGAWTLVQIRGDKQMADAAAGLLVMLISTSVIEKIARTTV